MFFLDFKRVLSRRLPIGFLEFFQPIIVALIVYFAFLAKETDDVHVFSTPFFYFTGLYAFWIGLFGSCQSLNGEVQSGEWSYWTLGLRRFIPFHILAVFAVNLASAFCKVVLFIVSVVLLSSICQDFNPFVSCFLTIDQLEADSFWQCGYMLKPLLIAKYGMHGPLIFAVCIYSLSLFAAMVCGVCFGMLLSLLSDPAVSLNASVAFVVLLGMVSLLGLQGDVGRTGSTPQDLKREFANRFESKYISTTGNTNKPVQVLIGFSKILPQRYFFNIARMPLEKYNDEDMIESICNDLDKRYNSETNWWRGKDEFPLSSDCGLTRWEIPLPPLENGNDKRDSAYIVNYIANYIKRDADFFRRYRIEIYWETFCKAQLLELAPLVWMCLCCLLVVNIGVLFLPSYRRLR